MTDEVVWATAFPNPLPKWGFRSGNARQIMEATALTERLRLEVAADPGNEKKVRAVLKTLVPDATDEDWESSTPTDIENLYTIALRKQKAAQAIVEARQKNEHAGNAETVTRRRSRSRRSSPTMTSPTSVAESPARTAPTTGP